MESELPCHYITGSKFKDEKLVILFVRWKIDPKLSLNDVNCSAVRNQAVCIIDFSAESLRNITLPQSNQPGR